MFPSRRAILAHSLVTAAAALSGAGPALAVAPSREGEAVRATYLRPYKAGTRVGALDIPDLERLEAMARPAIPKGAFDFFARGAGAEWTLRENRLAFERLTITPRVLTDKGPPDLKTSILGIPLASPVILAPIGLQGLAHVTAEGGTARGATAAGTLMAASTVTTLSLEQIAAAAPGPKWFQLYLMKDAGFSRALIQRAKAAGYRAIVLTVDTTATGDRETDQLDHFRFPVGFGNFAGRPGGANIEALNTEFAVRIGPEAVEFVAKESGLPVIVKGILHPDDARRAIAAGASAVQVSNHGGRQLDGSPATISALPAIADAVQGRVPIILDSGIRRGQDVFRALARGADVVGLGRPYIYGLILGGGPGVKSVLDVIERELAIVMQLAGTANVDEIKALRGG